MSRPFSYNDENFTIIGNVLFFHVLSIGALTSNKKLIEVPPEIFRRVVSRECIAFMSYDVIDYANSSVYPLVFKNMALIYKGPSISGEHNRYLTGFTLLNNI